MSHEDTADIMRRSREQRASGRTEGENKPLLKRGDPVVKHITKANPRGKVLVAKYKKSLAERRRNNAAMVVVQKDDDRRGGE